MIHPSILEKQRLAREFAEELGGIHDLGQGWAAVRADGLFRIVAPMGVTLPEALDMQFTSAQKAKKAYNDWKGLTRND